MVSFPGWSVANRRRCRCEGTSVIILGESLGGVESLIEHPGKMTHSSVAGTQLEVPSDLIRSAWASRMLRI